jgi:hypothetical protein
MSKTTYDPELRLSQEGTRLYDYWRRIRRNASVDPTWESYPAFHDWSMDNGYLLEMLLMRHDEELPYGPDNCYWQAAGGCDMPPWAHEWCEKWDKTVSKLRRQLGLPPLKGGEL